MDEGRRDTTRAAGGLLVPELLLIAASVIAVWVTYLAWLPCAGSMLEGTPFDPTPHEWTFTEACHAAMDHGYGFPVSGWLESPLQQTVNGLNTIALLLIGIAWLLLVRNWRRARPRGLAWVALASLPGLLNLWLAGVAAFAFVWPPDDYPAAAAAAILPMEIAGLVAVVVLLAGSEVAPTPLHVIRLVLLALATTANGAGHAIVDIIVMLNFSEANWDSPPGSGYLTAVSIALFAILSMILGGLGRLRRPGPARLVKEPVAIG